MLYKLSVIFYLIAIMFISGCNGTKNPVSEDNDTSDTPISATLDTQFKLKVNQTALIESENIKVKFLEVTEDSRCPSDVVCIWAGQVTIKVNVTKGDNNLGDITLTGQAGNEALATGTFDNFSIKLVQVDPYPISTRKIEVSDYIATLVISVKKLEM